MVLESYRGHHTSPGVPEVWGHAPHPGLDSDVRAPRSMMSTGQTDYGFVPLQPSHQSALRSQRLAPLNKHKTLGPYPGYCCGQRTYYEQQKAGNHHRCSWCYKWNGVHWTTARRVSRVSHGKPQLNSALPRSHESESSIGQSDARSLGIGLEMVFLLRASRR